MRKLKIQMQVSLDGYVAGANGEMDWMTWNWDDELKKYTGELTSSIDLILLGRKLAEGFIPTWESRLADPETADEAARTFVHTPKVVFSKTMGNGSWNNTHVENGDLTVEVNKLKAGNGKDIMTYGGAGFASALIKANLIDEYHLYINPTAIGKGLSIFGGITSNFGLSLTAAQAFNCGVTVLIYKPIS